MSKRGFGARRSLYAGLGRCCVSPTTTGLPKWGSAMPMFRWHKPATKRLKPESLSRPALIRYLRSAKPSGRPVANAHSANAPTLCLRLSHPNGVTKSTASSGFDHDTAEGWLQQGKADVIAFGRKVLANPDLPERVRSGASLNDLTTCHGGGAIGYTDYPTLARERGEEPHPCVEERWR
jgi:hypothetical protein